MNEKRMRNIELKIRRQKVVALVAGTGIAIVMILHFIQKGSGGVLHLLTDILK